MKSTPEEVEKIVKEAFGDTPVKEDKPNEPKSEREKEIQKIVENFNI
ncbi:MAG: hypothetical protein M0D53_09335 [Flavobacterium sp. JAD_PAG50586_2]|nr:MAG: hypothetical protein M0D53_09335 [Flavobacterium sp. JAD_PAG50586_2]